MPYTIDWDDEEKTIAIQKYSGSLTLEEYYDAVKARIAFISSAAYPVDLIVDVTNANTSVRGLISASRYANKHVPQNQRFVIIVGANYLIKMIVNTISKIAPQKTKDTHLVDTLDQAYERLAEQRAKLAVKV